MTVVDNSPLVTSEVPAPSALSQAGRGLLEIAWRRKALLALGIALGLIVGAFVFARTTPVYQSKAQVMVVKKRPDNVTGIDTRNLAIEDYVASHQALLKSPLIAERAVHQRDLHSLECLAGQADPAEAVLRALNVSRTKVNGVTTNNILELSFRGTRADECATVVNAVIDSFKDYLEETYRDTTADTLKLLTRARDDLLNKLTEKEVEYRKFREGAPVLLSRGKDGGLPQDRLTNIEIRRSSLLLRRAEVRGRLAHLEMGLKEGVGQAALLEAAARWVERQPEENSRANTQNVSIQAELLRLLTERERLLETRGPRHPEVEALDKRITLTRSFLSNPSAPWEEGLGQPTPKTGAAADALAPYRDHFKQELRQLDTALRQVDDLYKQEHTAARALELYQVKDEGFRSEQARLQKLYDSLVDRLKDANLVKDMGGYKAQLISPPRIGRKVQPNALLIFPLSLAAGLLGGIGLAYLAEVTDRSFRDVDEVRRRLRLPLVGQIPHLTAADARLRRAADNGHAFDPMLCTFYRPKSADAEAYRGLRTALYFSCLGEGHQVLQITSPVSGDGKTTLAANLAVSIAQSGKRVLLIDADLRRPHIHAIFGISAATGLGSIILGEAEPADSVQESGIPGLSLLPCGPIPPNPSELLTAPQFKELLDSLRMQYDFVIVDTPPLLAVTDPCVVAARVDAVLLNVRLTKNGRPAAMRAKDVLDTLGARVLGLVVNDTYRQAGGYGYMDGYHAEEEGGRPRLPASRNGQGEPRGVGAEDGDGSRAT
jgi:capsular exopolysaccharide synthesis family protein